MLYGQNVHKFGWPKSLLPIQAPAIGFLQNVAVTNKAVGNEAGIMATSEYIAKL